jgi:hypothetical protein
MIPTISHAPATWLVDENSQRPDALHVINLRQLRDAVNRIASFFDGVSMAYSAYRDYKADMQSAYW